MSIAARLFWLFLIVLPVAKADDVVASLPVNERWVVESAFGERLIPYGVSYGVAGVLIDHAVSAHPIRDSLTLRTEDICPLVSGSRGMPR